MVEQPETLKITGWRRVGLVATLIAWVGVGFIISQLAVIMLLKPLQSTGFSFDRYDEALVSAVVATISYLLALVVIIGGARWAVKSPVSLRLLGLQRLPKWSELGLAVVTVVVYLITSGLISLLVIKFVPGFDVEQTQETGFNFLSGRTQYILAFITLVGLAPLAEEVLFRGYLYGKLRFYLPWWLTALLVSALFGAAHGQWNVAIDTFVLSMFLCGLREMFGSIWPAITVHMLKNGLAYYFLFVNPMILNTLGG